MMCTPPPHPWRHVCHRHSPWVRLLACPTCACVECRSEVRSKSSADGAFLQVAPLPAGKSLGDVDDKFITKAVFSTEGRFGAYGAPTDVKVLKSESGTTRLLDIAFSALSPGQQEVPRRALVAAVQPEGAADV